MLEHLHIPVNKGESSCCKCSRCHHVQVYGKNRGSTTAKGRWLARGVETLMWQYPGLRVAYMDTNTGGGAARPSRHDASTQLLWQKELVQTLEVRPPQTIFILRSACCRRWWQRQGGAVERAGAGLGRRASRH